MAPSFLNQPQSQDVCIGDATSLSIVAAGSWPLTYQWQRDGENLVDAAGIEGSDTNRLKILAADATQIGMYRCIITNAHGEATSETVSLSIGGSEVPFNGTFIQPFVDAILSTEPTPALKCRFDFDGNNQIDANDIDNMVAALIGNI